MRFLDRADAGRRLAAALHGHRGQSNLLVLALPRGGVPVALEVARALHAPLDILIVRKLGVPGHEELAMGAIASGGVRVQDEDLIRSLAISPVAIEAVVERETRELERREREYRGRRPFPDLCGRRVIVIDDGLATGSTMRAAVMSLRLAGPEQVIVAVPVGASEACMMLRELADHVLCLQEPEPFHGVGQWYKDFRQVPDEEVHRILAGEELAEPL